MMYTTEDDGDEITREPLERGLPDRHQFLLRRERPRTTTAGLIRRVYSDVSSEDCRGFATIRPTGRGSAHVRNRGNVGR